MAGGDRKRTGDIDPPVFTDPVFNVESPNLQGPNGTLRGQATADRALDDIRRAVGGFAVSTSTADQIMRDMREGSALQRAIREANAAIGSFLANATSSSLLQQAKTATAGGAIAEARRLTGSFLDRVEPSTIAALSDQSVGSAEQKAARASIGAPFADAALRSSLSRLQDEFGERYARAMREITGIGSLGGVAARLASGSAEDLASTRGLLADVAARAAASREASTMSAALRRAHAALLPPLRRPTASEIATVVSATGSWSALSTYPDWMARARAGVTALSAPWVREDRPDLSLAAMARFGRLGGTVANLDPRDRAVSEELRARLGDYRGESVDEHADDDPALRVAGRYDRGFDPVLSSMPTRIVLAMLEPFGLRFDPQAADDEFGIDDIAAQMIRRLETRLLALVRNALDAAWGDEWIMHVPSEARSRMRRRQRQAEERGRPAAHLIVHADFGDWIQIIGREENWPLFAATFGSLDVLSETLEQIRPIRHDASHPRGVGPEDLLVLAANGKRLLRWIGAA
jgi:hypothetical protein